MASFFDGRGVQGTWGAFAPPITGDFKFYFLPPMGGYCIVMMDFARILLFATLGDGACRKGVGHRMAPLMGSDFAYKTIVSCSSHLSNVLSVREMSYKDYRASMRKQDISTWGSCTSLGDALQLLSLGIQYYGLVCT